MPVSKDADGNPVTKTFEGDFHSWDYATHEGVSEIQVFRNFETALKQGGFTIAYEASPDVITAHKGAIRGQMIESKGNVLLPDDRDSAGKMQAGSYARMQSSLSDEIRLRPERRGRLRDSLSTLEKATIQVDSGARLWRKYRKC